MADARKSTGDTKTSETKKSNSRTIVVEKLGTVLASTYALRIKTQNFHWNVTGPNFIALHELFEAQYVEQAAAIDTIAERIRALGAVSPGSFATFAELSVLEDAPAKPPADKAMIEILASDHAALSKLCRDVSSTAEEAEDMATADLMNGRTAAHDKAAWMLSAHLA